MKHPFALIILVLLLIGVGGGSGYKYWQNQNKPADDGRRSGTPQVVAYVVTSHPFSDQMEAVGTAMANESATLTANVADTVTAINFQEGTPVTAGTVLVQLKDDEEKAELEDARRTASRYNELAKTNATSIAQKDASAAALKVAEARISDRQIIAPFDGITGFRHISPGDLLNPGTVVTVLYDLDPIKLEFTLPERFLSVLESGLEITARTQAWPDQVFNGTVTVIDPGINPVTRAVSLKAEIPNPDGKLKPGLLMTVSVIKDQRQALSVPEAALIQQGQQHQVFVIDQENQANMVPVTIGSREAGYVEITSGLAEGDTIVAEGLLKLRPGLKVNIIRTTTLEEIIKAATAMASPRKQEALK